jgi:hypothetical protein
MFQRRVNRVWKEAKMKEKAFECLSMSGFVPFFRLRPDPATP